jgi:large subunit ribosomal protein L17
MMNLAIALIQNKRIFTTLAKAKALRTYVEPLITRSKDDTTHSRRIAFSYLKNKDAVSTLFKDVAGKVAERNGGYTRIIKTGNRQGESTRRRGKKSGTAKAKATEKKAEAPGEAASE